MGPRSSSPPRRRSASHHSLLKLGGLALKPLPAAPPRARGHANIRRFAGERCRSAAPSIGAICEYRVAPDAGAFPEPGPH